MVGAKLQEVEEAVELLKEKYNQPESGVWLVENKTLRDKEVQLATSPDSQSIVQKFLRDELTGELTRPALETLTIIAYRGPMTKPEIEQIRGINCSLILRNLLIKGLVEIEERQKDPYYRISFEFMKYLGISNVSELPDYDELHQHESLEEYLENTNPHESVRESH